MANVLLGIDDPSEGREIYTALEEAGHDIVWVPALEVTPTPGRKNTELLIVDGEAPGMDLGVVTAAWRRQDPPPVLLVLGTTAVIRANAEKVRGRFLAKPVVADELVAEVQRVANPYKIGSLGPAAALVVLGMSAGGLPEDEAAAIVAGARSVDLTHVRESLRPRMHHYATATAMLDRLCARRALSHSEARLAIKLLDGSRTVRGAIDGAGRSTDSVPEALPAHTAARLLWGLISGGAVALAPEPPANHPTSRLRAHVRVRTSRLAAATHYGILETGPEVSLGELDRVTGLLEHRYGPEALVQHDLGDLQLAGNRAWELIASSRQVLGDTYLRAAYDAQLFPARNELEDRRGRRRTAIDEAERLFLRGQQALGSGDVFRAVSDFASAARRLPDQPDYEVYAAWARVLAEEARGGDRAAAARRDKEAAQKSLLGRRPYPRAELIVGLLCEAAGDTGAAIAHLRDALAVDDKLAAARQALARLGG